ncbi:MAG: restriction endonuclease subunit S, partial [Acetobacter sp.]|nr:restriction endonuclease subunit S [Acetobacter sp.]
KLKKQPFPLPPLEIQHKIVEILDKFDTLTTSLTEGIPAEIEARRKQYHYYRDKLLSFKDLAPSPKE